MARRARLTGLTVAQLERLLERKRREAKIAPLERERDRLGKRLRKIEVKIARLNGAAVAVARPRKKKKKLSAAARRKMSLAKKRWWAKAKAKKRKAVTRKRKPASKPQAAVAAAATP